MLIDVTTAVVSQAGTSCQLSTLAVKMDQESLVETPSR